jgi:hypothetical protein
MQSRWTGKKDMGFHPIQPILVAEVKYDHMQGDRFRHVASFVRWRPDREPDQLHLRTTRTAGQVRRRRRSRGRGALMAAKETFLDVAGREVRVSNPDKVYFPEPGTRSCEVVSYYAAVAPFMLPYVLDRPTALERWPDGVHEGVKMAQRGRRVEPGRGVLPEARADTRPRLDQEP